MRDVSKLVLTCLVVVFMGCSDDTDRPQTDGGPFDGPGNEDGNGTIKKKLTWLASESLDENKAGKYTAMASCGDQLGVVYFRVLKDPVKVMCQSTLPGGQPEEKARPAQDLYYIHYDGTAWGAPVKVDQTIGPPFGASVAMEPGSCTVHVGYLGGEVGLAECSSSDAIIATSSDGGQNWAKKTVSATGGVGDTVGHWMSVAVDSTGAVHSAYRDVHFGYYEQDGNAKASLWYDNTKVSGDDGSGVYAALAFDPNDDPVVLHYNGTKAGAEGGIQIAYSKSGGKWQLEQLLGGSTSELPSLATDGKGKFGVAYYKPSKQALFFMESADLTSWSDDQIDTNLTRNGEFSSVAYDSKGNPAISYYVCNDYGETKCDFSKDGLNFIHKLGSWKMHEGVDDGGPQRCGVYTALAFDTADDPVIAYMCVAYDNLSGEWKDTLKVIRGVYK